MDQAEINILRQKIRDCDDRILREAASRIKIAGKIGRIKMVHALEIDQPTWENEVFTSNQETAADLGLDAGFAMEITKVLVKYAKRAQSQKNYG